MRERTYFVYKLRLAMRIAWQILFFPLPWMLRRFALEKLLGFRLHPKSRIGAALILAENVVLEEGARIGGLTIVSPLKLLHLHRHATIGRGNRIVGWARTNFYGSCPDRQAALIMHEHSAITRHHLLDCSDRIEIGRFSLIAGWRTQILTHSPDFDKNLQVSSPTVIGSFCFIGSASILLKGAVVPDFCIVSAGSVLVPGERLEPYSLIASAPGRTIKKLSPTLGYFHRDVGRIP